MSPLRDASNLPPATIPDIDQFDADEDLQFEAFFAMAKRLGIIDDLQVEVLRRAVETGRRTERKCISEYWAQVAARVGMSKRYRYRCEMSVAALADAPEEIRAAERELSPRHSGMWVDEKGTFSLAECLEPLVTPRWLKLKQLGSDALYAGECELAATWYARAASVTDHQTAVDAFFNHLEDCCNHAARRLAAMRDDLCEPLLKQMPDGPRRLAYPPELKTSARGGMQTMRPYAYEPNLPRAICHANTAAARLRQLREHDEGHKRSMAQHGWLPPHLKRMGSQIRVGLADAALKAAEDAAMVCPEYTKGHHRVLAALKAIVGRIEESSNETDEDDEDQGLLYLYVQKADEVENATFNYGLAHGRLPWSGIAALVAGFLQRHEFEHAYAAPYMEHEMRAIKQAGARTHIVLDGLIPRISLIPMRVIVKVSLVPSCGGQALLICVQRIQLIGANDVEEDHSHDGLVFETLDTRHGDSVEAPPHGRASKLSLSRFPSRFSRFLADLRREKIEIDEICLGQALRNQVQKVRTALDNDDYYRDVSVYASAITHASKLAEPGGRERETRRFLENSDR